MRDEVTRALKSNVVINENKSTFLKEDKFISQAFNEVNLQMENGNNPKQHNDKLLERN